MRRIGGRAIDWVIVGGESGPGARPMHPEWARSVRDQCQAAGIPFLFKQWGEWMPSFDAVDAGYLDGKPVTHGPYVQVMQYAGGFPRPGEPAGDGCICVSPVGKKKAGRLLDGREWNEYPEARP